jgi:hypothetical protein
MRLQIKNRVEAEGCRCDLSQIASDAEYSIGQGNPLMPVNRLWDAMNTAD